MIILTELYCGSVIKIVSISNENSAPGHFKCVILVAKGDRLLPICKSKCIP